jgi:hypothetical protein
LSFSRILFTILSVGQFLGSAMHGPNSHVPA